MEISLGKNVDEGYLYSYRPYRYGGSREGEVEKFLARVGFSSYLPFGFADAVFVDSDTLR